MLARREEAVTKKKWESVRGREGGRAKRDEHPRLLLLKTHSSNFPSTPSRPFYHSDVLFRLCSLPPPSLPFLLFKKDDVFFSFLFLRTSPFSFSSLFFLFSVQHPSSLPSHSALPLSPQPILIRLFSSFRPREKKSGKRRVGVRGGWLLFFLATTFLFIRHGGRGIKGESCSTLLMLRLAQARFLHVYERCHISGSQERFCLFYTRDFFT